LPAIVAAELLDDAAFSQHWREATEKFGVGRKEVDDVVRQIRASWEQRRASTPDALDGGREGLCG